MPMMKLSPLTMQLVRSKRPPGFELSGHLPRLNDGSWLVAISDQVLVAIVEARVRGEPDDGVVLTHVAPRLLTSELVAVGPAPGKFLFDMSPTCLESDGTLSLVLRRLECDGHSRSSARLLPSDWGLIAISLVPPQARQGRWWLASAPLMTRRKQLS